MIKTDIFRYKSCRLSKENCKLQKMHKTTHVHNLCGPSGILEDFVHKGAFSVLPVPRRHLHRENQLRAWRGRQLRIKNDE